MCTQKISKIKIKQEIGYKKIKLFLVKQMLFNNINY